MGTKEPRSRPDAMLTTREVAAYLDVNEKMVYSLIAEKGLPATKVTGKWLFPRHLVDQWVELNTINYPGAVGNPAAQAGAIIAAGSNDPLLEGIIAAFNRRYPAHMVAFANLGSMGGLRALRRNLCHVASCHLLQEDGEEYNFTFAAREFDAPPAVINFCWREQGLLVKKGNPLGIQTVADLGRRGVRVVNRALGTGTRLLFDRELQKAGIPVDQLQGYGREVSRHLDVGLEIVAGRADAGPGIRAVAGLLAIDCVPLRWERYDLLIAKDRFFDEGIQLFVNFLQEPELQALADNLTGYDIRSAGKMVYPGRPHQGDAAP